ncbi:MAG: DUF348 domain-containing protein [Propionibacteriales bacterium]|nr:DUF348 domain-containing protein [Propionibacteriales bacterium]
MSKTVTLSIDGKVKDVKTFGDTVEEVLDDEGIELGDHDAVAPSPSSGVEDGSRIAVRYGRELTLTVDGKKSNYWVTATSVDTALSQIGLRFSNAELSASRGAPIGREGLDLTVKTVKKVDLVLKGKASKRTTTALTVADALKDMKVKTDSNDEVKPDLKSAIKNGSNITVVKIDKKTVTGLVSIPNKTVVREDDKLYEDQEKVVEEGRNGAKRVTLSLVYADGEMRSKKTLKSAVVRKPVDRVEAHGTKSRPEPTSDFSGGNTVWDRLADCESGGNWAINTGNGYYGGLQFNVETWEAYGGSGLPSENSRETQISIAEKVRDANGGYGAWPGCAAELGLPT